MGLQINLIKMLGFPSNTVCPKCGKITSTGFQDYDLESGPEHGNWKLFLSCEHCDHDWRQRYDITVKKIS
jgi:hypothetical protein